MTNTDGAGRPRGFQNPPLPWAEMERRLSGRGASSATRSPGTTNERTANERTQNRAPGHSRPVVPYAELHAHTHYSFLDGANSPEDMLQEASRLQLAGLALTDNNGLYGAAEFAAAATAHPELLTVYGAELTLSPTHPSPHPAPHTRAAKPSSILVLAEGQTGYHRLASAITDAQLAGSGKQQPRFTLEALAASSRDSWMILTGCSRGQLQQTLAAAEAAGSPSDRHAAGMRVLEELTSLFGRDRVVVELNTSGHPGDDVRCKELAELAAAARLPTVVTGAVHAATRYDTQLAETAAAIRARQSLSELNPHLDASGANYLRDGETMARLHSRTPEAVRLSAELARQLAFSLQSAKPQLPHQHVPPEHTEMSWLRELVWQGVAKRYPNADSNVTSRIEKELRVIAEKNFPGYFLIVHDIVQEARRRGILCQGRGSAANSAVCYTLEITSVDSIYYNLPFERFLSSMREEEPDIDVDFDAARREEIIQYVYDKYGRRNAAQVANFITYQPKAAVRDAAKALGYSTGQQRAFTKTLERGSFGDSADNRRHGLSPNHHIPENVQNLAARLMRSPRHLGIHSGGMVITDRPVSEVCPIEPARMPGRTVLQWDKESCATMGLVKFDLLSLGMLNALQQSFDIITQSTGETWDLDRIPKEEPGVYDMLCRGDAIGVFQVESRAQLNTLPRLLPRCFEDLVIEIALIRPGPVQGGAVHPYLRRRSGDEAVSYAHPALEPVLKRTLGVPLFQEQLMQMAMAVGGCTAEDADLLRRAMGSKRGVERIDSLKQQLFEGMARNGIPEDAAEKIYAQIEAFAGFGFAESHSISFALIVYASSWIKLHYPAAFLAGLLRAQPMGFYAPRTLVADARRHGVTVRAPDVFWSGVHSDLELLVPAAGARTKEENTAGAAATGMPQCTDPEQPPVGDFDRNQADTSAQHRRDGHFAVRLGLSEIRGLSAEAKTRIVRARAEAPFHSLEDLARRANLNTAALEALAKAGACDSFGLTRREALWRAAPAAQHREEFLAHTGASVQLPLLPSLSDSEQVALDLWSTGVHTTHHPVALLRDDLDAQGVTRSDLLPTRHTDELVTVAGIVTHRQRPGTAGGITFVTLEDEHGSVNIIVWRRVWERYRLLLRTAPALTVRGRLERTPEGVFHVIGQTFTELSSPRAVTSRDFH